jgi:adhesin transport system membrane fusion protein
MLKKISEFKAKHRHFEEDRDYLTDVNAANLYGASFKSHMILWIFLSFSVIALIWANYATLDEVTRGSGKIIPSSHIQVIQNLEGGILAEMLVKEGELVEKGQTLMRLDDVRFSSSFNETKLKHFELLVNTERLTAEVNNQPFQVSPDIEKNYPSLVDNARRLYQSRQNELQTNIDILQQQVRQKEQELVELNSKSEQISRSYQMLRQELEMSEPLVKDGAMSEVELLRIKRSANDLRGELSAAQLAIPRLRSFIAEAKNKIEEQKIRFHTEALQELNATKAELDRTSESILALKDRVTRTRITSPVKGTVKQFKISTIGGIIQPGMDMLEIVPIEDQLLVETQIRPADIAFLRPGQEAMVKLTAYEYSIYGGLEAELEHISADTIINEEDNKSYYLIRLRTHKNYLEKNGEKLSIIPGMTADVDILTGKKSVLDYILKPIYKAKQRAMRER